MKKLLFLLKKTSGAFFISAAITSMSAQQSGATKQTNQISGKQIYKSSKSQNNNSPKKPKELRIMDNVQARIEYDFERLKNPSTNEIPAGIREAELKVSSTIPIGDDSKQSLDNVAKSSDAKRYSYWKNRGPYNVGGRTRALAIDRTNENVILAGGVSGGLWRSNDSGKTWEKVTRSFQDPSITAIVQDPRPNHSNTWYYASGERFGNSASAGGAFYQGSGIYKSQDNGRTWEHLAASNANDVTTFETSDFISALAIDPTNGDLYVASLNSIQRSQDGGNSFEIVLEGDIDFGTDIAITSTGQMYATMLSSQSTKTGLFTSSDGDTWTEISHGLLEDGVSSGFLTIVKTAIGIDPSNEDTVYFLTVGFSEASGENSYLYRYDATAVEEERWTDLTENLPKDIGGSVGDLNLQGGYNMLVQVSPADSNLVFIGGTNLYRSTTGFTTPAGQDSWIGGYSPLNNIDIYPDQHPDQHILVFYPSNPNKVLSGTDGGVAVTEDITTSLSEFEPVDWVSLNNGYTTTQPYHVSFDPEANSDDLLAGFQDNSTWFTDSTNPTDPWVDLLGGDGSYSAIADGGATKYVSYQFGNLFRLNYDKDGVLESYATIQPYGAQLSNFSFINPFILDPNNDNVMYMPVGNTIWRNDNLDDIPNSAENETAASRRTTVNWVEQTQTNVNPIDRITALDVSTYPVANRLYYGTLYGGIFRMDNANIDNQEGVLILGEELPIGYVNDINVDPSNADRVIVTLSNYGIPSLFLTEDGGETWTDISGNLEENEDGSGNGPSVRSTAFFGSSIGNLGKLQRVYAATSTGLYYTNRLKGNNTVWRKENSVIGTAIADEVVTRKDGFIAVAAHGNGLFSAKFPIINKLPESTLKVAYAVSDFPIENETEETEFEVDISNLFVQSAGKAIDIELTNSNTDLIEATLDGDIIRLTVKKELVIGEEANIGIIAKSEGEQVSEGFTIHIIEKSLYDQTIQEFFTRLTPGIYYTDVDQLVQAADDFTVPEGETWTIDRVLAYGFSLNLPSPVGASVVIYQDNNGKPGEQVYHSGIIEIPGPTANNQFNLDVLLEEGEGATTLESGKYWLSAYANIKSTEFSIWTWEAQEVGFGEVMHQRDESNTFDPSFWGEWNPLPATLGGPNLDLKFTIYGETTDGSTTKSLVSPVAQSGKVIVEPNPSTDKFSIIIDNADSKEVVSLKVYDLVGNEVYSNNDIDTASSVEFDASMLKTGVYILKLSGGIQRTAKLVKK